MDIGYGAKVVPLGGGHIQAPPSLIEVPGAGSAKMFAGDDHDVDADTRAAGVSGQRSVIPVATEVVDAVDVVDARESDSPTNEGYILA
jgi:hypothetical protein